MISQFDNINYDTICCCISRISSRFPFADIRSIGKTVCKRDIYSLNIGSGKKSILFLGGMRGNDCITSALLLRFFERLCISYKNNLKISAIKTSNILKEQRITVIPLVNPDGMQISIYGSKQAYTYENLVTQASNNFNGIWNSNARGVEPYLNFNYSFPACIQHNRPMPFGNFGPYPESENESKAIADFVRANNIKYSVLLSANGEKIIYSPPKSKSSENVLMAQIFKSISGFPISARTSGELCGSFCEWFSDTYARSSFEFSFNEEKIFDSNKFEHIYKAQEELIMLSAIM